ncbi:hypothetical protein M9458_006819 [Cirrhinus mrigala]|uniref:RING-type domain-containing protein n=1 Tax=Cirrhinus mrigala TaxID=683832 RepID=A0ABD0RII7_CIRMR
MAESLPTLPKQREAWRQSLDIPPSGPLTEELQCSVCLDVFTDPVSTPCRHNFCKSCLNQCWDKSEDCYCPHCKETFSERPDLKINTTLRQVVQHFKEKSAVTKSEVLCDICDDRKLKALKSCLILIWSRITEDDQTPVCPICTVTDHKNHNTVPLEQESEEKKA